MNGFTRKLVRAWVLAAATLPAVNGWAAPDDTERQEKPAPQLQVGRVNPENFEQWVYQSARNEQTAKIQLQARLDLQLKKLARVYDLSDVQKRKLQLAADGDIERFFQEVDVVRQKFLSQLKDPNALGQIWPQIQPLQVKMATGLFGERSLFAKVLSHTLSEEQDAQRQADALVRQRFRYRASVEAAIAMLEDAVPLEDKQREKLIALIVDKTEPPAVFGQHDYYYVMYSLASLPQNDVMELLDERQKTLLRAQLQQGRGMRQMLIQNGAIEAPNRR
jgi:hypothetical protein